METGSASALFLGTTSMSCKVRGNGRLIVTNSYIYFRILAPCCGFEEIEIPLKSIQTIEKVNSFNGRYNAQSIVKITFTNDQGNTDHVGWILRDIDTWISKLNEMVSSTSVDLKTL